MKTYYVIYKSFQKPGTEYYEVLAENKHDAKMKFLQTGIKHDYVIRIML